MVEITRFDNVWDALSDDREEAENMKLRADLMDALRRQIEARGWRQVDAAQHLGVTQPRISNLFRGRVSLFSLDMLVNMASTAGLDIEMTVAEPAA